jgi:hypothetical protein
LCEESKKKEQRRRKRKQDTLGISPLRARCHDANDIGWMLTPIKTTSSEKPERRERKGDQRKKKDKKDKKDKKEKKINKYTLPPCIEETYRNKSPYGRKKQFLNFFSNEKPATPNPNKERWTDIYLWE